MNLKYILTKGDNSLLCNWIEQKSILMIERKNKILIYYQNKKSKVYQNVKSKPYKTGPNAIKKYH